MARALRSFVLLAAAAAVSACSVTDTKAPALSGPSELGLSLTLQASPDTLTQDGSSQSTLTILARDGSGQPVKSVSLRVEIKVDGTVADYGTLSSKNVTTGSDGRASTVYTAPAPSAVASSGSTINLAVTPVNGNYANAVERLVSIKLVPAGSITPPGGVPAYFSVSPASPAEMEAATFAVTFCSDKVTSACTPTTGATAYNWTFGDGTTATGSMVIHSYSSGGTYLVTLTILDSKGWASSNSQSLTVKAGTGPTASFTVTPSSPKVLQDAIFDGSGSTASTGRRIVSYEWNFGDGTVKIRTESFTNHDFGAAGQYPVTLKVTDDAGRTATKMIVVTVTP